MKTSFKTQGTLVSLKTLDYQVAVYPGMFVLLNQKYYTVRHAVLDLEKEEILVVVERSLTEPA
ncbi:hypothetical protein [Adhaeribacter rhizoryzae]|uniref:Uncharacterized protein n=1 Tax=Adhaeribacter rhizoryzae TaxID=2607907 RepID=A0A5M6CZ95_9BACT|nr:hypothetical protein [Adhaeribacter rhizoryzae]KAA5540558.1 hypothetical protein F0145_22345 [Adhaeribacter rhizoryzae]